jgi:hypothetical protein
VPQIIGLLTLGFEAGAPNQLDCVARSTFAHSLASFVNCYYPRTCLLAHKDQDMQPLTICLARPTKSPEGTTLGVVILPNKV